MRGVMFALGFLVIWGRHNPSVVLVLAEVGRLQGRICGLAILYHRLGHCCRWLFFALFKLQVFRNLQPHLTISHEITHRVVSDSYVHISVTAVLHNSSRVKVEIEEGSFHLLRIAPVTDEEVARAVW